MVNDLNSKILKDSHSSGRQCLRVEILRRLGVLGGSGYDVCSGILLLKDTSG